MFIHARCTCICRGPK